MNIAVFTKNWLGDVIFETPAIRAIKENFPESHLIAVTPRRCVELLEFNPYVDEIIAFDEKEDDRSMVSKLRLILTLRKRNIDRAYLFHRSSTRARIAWLGGARERIGYQVKGGSFLTRAIPEQEGPVHDVQYFMDLVRNSGLKVNGEYAYEFYFGEEDEARARSLLAEYGLDSERLVAINPGANWPPKRWPAEYFRELADRLITRYDVQIVLTGSDEDQPTIESILNSHDRVNLVSVCGKTTIRQLGALFSICRLVISNDTGPLHIAAGVGANVIGLFGPTQPLETAPLGRGRNIIIHYAPEGVPLPWIGKDFPSPWMELISVEDVFKAIEQEKLLSS
ncbi:MAG: lipopolysaccharide heptosyltransferase II [Candidatus Omnitrophica bacterium]|nr:lipopolysaccharide heptosyltransferase II [Candidatus Omnitrophota bacterium]